MARLKNLIGAFSGRRPDACRDDVDAQNLRVFRAFSAGGLALSAVSAALGFLLFGAGLFPPVSLLALPYFAVLFVISRYLVGANARHIRLIFYLAELPLMVLAVITGTFLYPRQPSITIMIYLCVLPLFILDKPWRIALYITCTAAAYAVCCRLAKSKENFSEDMANLLSFWLVALSVNALTFLDRMGCVETLVKYRNISEHDRLTGTYNRGGGERINLMLRERIPGAFIIVDVDNFKTINDTYGHEAGDEALILLTETITRDFRSTDVTMRLGGDEFIVYAAGMADEAKCRKKLEELLGDIRKISLPGAGEQPLTVSMGCVLNFGADADFQSLYRRADACLYNAKKSGKGRYEIEG